MYVWEVEIFRGVVGISSGDGRGRDFWDGFENFRVGLTFFREGLRFCMVEKFQGVKEFF